MSKYKGKIVTYVFVLAMALLLCGCGSTEEAEVSEKSNVEVFDDGHIEARLVELFDQSYYSESELMEMVNEEITTYNLKEGGEPIQVLSEQLDGENMILDLYFATAEDYSSYMPDSLFVGTVNDAYQDGYDFNRSLNVVGKDDVTIGKKDLLNMAKHNLIILTGDTILCTPSKITYYSQGMTLLDSKTIESDGEGTYFVIYK